jgi:hypothetical protein
MNLPMPLESAWCVRWRSSWRFALSVAQVRWSLTDPEQAGAATAQVRIARPAQGHSAAPRVRSRRWARHQLEPQRAWAPAHYRWETLERRRTSSESRQVGGIPVMSRRSEKSLVGARIPRARQRRPQGSSSACRLASVLLAACSRTKAPSVGGTDREESRILLEACLLRSDLAAISDVVCGLMEQ